MNGLLKKIFERVIYYEEDVQDAEKRLEAKMRYWKNHNTCKE